MHSISPLLKSKNYPLSIPYSEKTEAEKKRIVDSFPNLNPTCKMEDIRSLLNIIDSIQSIVNGGNLTEEALEGIKTSLMTNNALPPDCNRQNLMDDLILAATHKPPFYSRIEKFNYFILIIYTKTMKNIISKIKQNYCLYPNGDLHVGHFNSNGERNGYGTKTFTTYDEQYRTHWKDDAFHGKGIGQYTGFWKNEQFHGEGTYTWADGRQYQGAWKNGMCHGYGTLTNKNGGKYEGQWKKDERHGSGTQIRPDGIQYSGHWEHDKYHGTGTFTFPNGDKYTGHWQDLPRGGISLFHIDNTKDNSIAKKVILFSTNDGLIIDDVK